MTLQSLSDWWNGPAKWWEVWKATQGCNLFLSGVMIFAIIAVFFYLIGD